MKIGRPVKHTLEKDKLKTYVDQGLSHREISQIYKLSEWVIGYWIKKHNLKTKYSKQKEFYIEKNLLQKYLNQNLSINKIAKILGTVKSTVYFYMKQYKINTYRPPSKDGPIHRVTIENGVYYKICSCCNIKKEVSNFYIDKSSQWVYTNKCKICYNEHRSKILSDTKKECVNYRGGCCLVCKYNKHLGSLDFHHLDPKKKDFNISKTNWKFEALKSELDKCVILCANCHREFHAGLINLEEFLPKSSTNNPS